MRSFPTLEFGKQDKTVSFMDGVRALVSDSPTKGPFWDRKEDPCEQTSDTISLAEMLMRTIHSKSQTTLEFGKRDLDVCK